MTGPWRRHRGPGPLRPIPERRAGRANRLVVREINAILAAEAADLPMHRAVRVHRHGWYGIRVSYHHIDGRASGVPDDSVHPDGSGHVPASAINAILAHVRAWTAEQRIRIAAIASGWRPGEQDPAWTVLVAEAHLALLHAAGVPLDDLSAEFLPARLAARARHVHAECDLDMVDRALRGTVALADQSVRAVTAPPGIVLAIRMTMPETLITALAGLPIDRVALVGPGMPGTTITAARTSPNGLSVGLDLDSPLVPLVPAPAGFDPAWIATAAKGPGSIRDP